MYASKTRFIYELIQNAEDNQYNIAKKSEEDPWLHFRLFDDRMIIDSNEDGFKESDVESLCSVNQSTKKHKLGYIGEKGIGFKSVFKIARKVRIQSGPFSFAFSYRQNEDDDDLGMVTPLLEEYDDSVPTSVRTRMTLYLLDACSDAVRKDLLDLPESLLLFLKTIKKIEIEIKMSDYDTMHLRYSLSKSDSVAKISKKDLRTNLTKNFHYKIFRREVKEMPYCDERKDVNETDVVVAFPVDVDDRPIIEDQYVFAFLPMRKAGFKVSRIEVVPIRSKSYLVLFSS